MSSPSFPVIFLAFPRPKVLCAHQERGAPWLSFSLTFCDTFARDDANGRLPELRSFLFASTTSFPFSLASRHGVQGDFPLFFRFPKHGQLPLKKPAPPLLRLFAPKYFPPLRLPRIPSSILLALSKTQALLSRAILSNGLPPWLFMLDANPPILKCRTRPSRQTVKLKFLFPFTVTPPSFPPSPSPLTAPWTSLPLIRVSLMQHGSPNDGNSLRQPCVRLSVYRPSLSRFSAAHTPPCGLDSVGSHSPATIPRMKIAKTEGGPLRPPPRFCSVN